jgi:hypothetical protein
VAQETRSKGIRVIEAKKKRMADESAHINGQALAAQWKRLASQAWN